MNIERIEKIVMDNMPPHEGSRSTVTVGVDGVQVTYNRPYSPRWGFGGWSADQVTVNGEPVEVKRTWVRNVR